jgi:hypothetical protein
MVYIVNYELRTSDKDYTSLYNFLEHEFGRESIHVFHDTWWVDLPDNQDVSQLTDQLKSHMGDKDIFYISKVSNGDIDGWLGRSTWDFYRSNKEKA